MLVTCENKACKYNGGTFCIKPTVVSIAANGQCSVWFNSRRIPSYQSNTPIIEAKTVTNNEIKTKEEPAE